MYQRSEKPSEDSFAASFFRPLFFRALKCAAFGVPRRAGGVVELTPPAPSPPSGLLKARNGVASPR
jgi:hypothetical protein